MNVNSVTAALIGAFVCLAILVWYADDVTEDGLVFRADVSLTDKPVAWTSACDGSNKVYLYNGNISVVKDDVSCL
jgi:hypothetical protein